MPDWVEELSPINVIGEGLQWVWVCYLLGYFFGRRVGNSGVNYRANFLGNTAETKPGAYTLPISHFR